MWLRGFLALSIKDVFDPKGRIDRLTLFAYGAMLILLEYTVELIRQNLLLLLGTPPPFLITIFDGIEIAALLLLRYGLFCIYAKRLHDINLPAIVGLLLFGGNIAGLILPVTEADFDPVTGAALTWQANAGSLVDRAVFAGQLFLLIIPGQRRPNRYGFSSNGIELPRSRPEEG